MIRSVTDFLPEATSSPISSAKRTEQLALLIGKIGGNDHAQLHDQAATRTATANARHAVIIDAHGVAVLGAGGVRTP